MNYTFIPKHPSAGAKGTGTNISFKNAQIICRAIRRKKLSQAKRLLGDIIEKKRSLSGKYYTKTAKEIMKLIESCEKNAEFKGLKNEMLFVYASAHRGRVFRRNRRRSKFGSRLKMTKMEVLLVEKGKEKLTGKRKTEIPEKVKMTEK